MAVYFSARLKQPVNPSKLVLQLGDTIRGRHPFHEDYPESRAFDNLHFSPALLELSAVYRSSVTRVDIQTWHTYDLNTL